MVDKKIPDIIIGRLPKYLRSLQRMDREGRLVTSSKEMGERLGISAAQIRKDLSQFGEFGKQGKGYSVPFLIKQLSEILHVNHDWEVAVVGAGDIGSAVAHYKGFANRGFKIVLLFDNDPQRIGTRIGELTIQDYSLLIETIQEKGIKIAIVAVPVTSAQEVTDNLVKAGVKAILSYAPVIINHPQDVYVQYIDPSIHLQRMTYYLD